MKFPRFIEKKDVLGVFAPSAGVGRKLDEFNQSITQLKNQGFDVKLGPLVEVNDLRSGTGRQRAEELSMMQNDDSIKALLCAAGGDFLIEMLPYVNFKELAENPKCEICAFKNGVWLRVAAELVEDDRVEARKSMLDEYTGLRKMYDENDGNTQVLYLKNAVATFTSFTAEPEVHTF
jgi:hypothetical protein